MAIEMKSWFWRARTTRIITILVCASFLLFGAWSFSRRFVWHVHSPNAEEPVVDTSLEYSDEVRTLRSAGCEVMLGPRIVTCVQPDATLPIISRCHTVQAVLLQGQTLNDRLCLLSALPELHSLVIRSCSLSPGALMALSSMAVLQELTITSSNVRDEEVPGLTTTQLTYLDLSYNPAITGYGLMAIGDTRQIRQLHLYGTGVRDLAFLKGMPRLEELHLGFTQIGDDDIRIIVGLSSLRVLDLSSTCISDEAVDAIRQLTSLRLLDVRYTNISKDGLNRISTSIPNASIDWSATTDDLPVTPSAGESDSNGPDAGPVGPGASGDVAR